MDIYRKQDLSIYYWIEGLVPSTVNVSDGFPEGTLELPTVSITSLDMSGKPHEIGGYDLNINFWRIDIFAENVVQRDKLATMLYAELEHNVPVYDYDEGFPPAVSPTQIGTLIVNKRQLKPIHVFEDLVEKLYWRSGITFFSYYESRV